MLLPTLATLYKVHPASFTVGIDSELTGVWKMAPRYSITLFELYHPQPTPLYFFFARKTRDGMFSSVEKLRVIIMKLGPGVASWLRPCTTSRMVPESIPGGVIGDFFRGSFRQNHVS